MPAQLVLVDKEDLSVTHVDLPENSAPYGIASQVATGGSVCLNRLLCQWSLRFVDIAPDLRGLSILSDGSVAITRWRSPEDGGEVYLWRDGSLSRIGYYRL